MDLSFRHNLVTELSHGVIQEFMPLIVVMVLLVVEVCYYDYDFKLLFVRALIAEVVLY